MPCDIPAFGDVDIDGNHVQVGSFGLISTGPANPRKLGLMVGQAAPGPPESLPPEYMPFDGSPGSRLAKLGGYGSTEELWEDFDRIDLVECAPVRKFRHEHHRVEMGYQKHNWDGHVFPRRKAKVAARDLLRSGELTRDYVIVVLCGKKVADAFDLKVQGRPQPWAEEVNGVLFLVLPHPSGVSHLWNNDIFWLRTAGFFRAYLKAARAFLPEKSNVPRDDQKAAGVKRKTRAPASTAAKARGRRLEFVPQAATTQEENILINTVQGSTGSKRAKPKLGPKTGKRSRFFRGSSSVIEMGSPASLGSSSCAVVVRRRLRRKTRECDIAVQEKSSTQCVNQRPS